MNGADVNLQTDMNKDNSPEQSAGDASGVSSKGAGMRPCSPTNDYQNQNQNEIPFKGQDYDKTKDNQKEEKSELVGKRNALD